MAICVAVSAVILLFARGWVNHSVRGRIYHDISKVPNCRVALVLGTQALPGEQPSPRLASRCDKAIELYKLGKVAKLLMSGDGRASSNNEPDTMKAYAIARGVPAKDIITDPFGMRTYDSVYHAKHVYGGGPLVVVSQAFHVSRSLFLGRAVGLEAYAVPAEMPGEPQDQVRECFACLSALLDAYVIKPKAILEKKENN